MRDPPDILNDMTETELAQKMKALTKTEQMLNQFKERDDYYKQQQEIKRKKLK